jgi:hypothetical protein
MILEVAMLNVRSSMESEFEAAFAKASAIIASMRGYISMNSTAASKSQTAIYFLSGGKPLKTILLGFVVHLNMINGSSYFTISMIHFQRLSILKKYYNTRTILLRTQNPELKIYNR